MKSTKYEIGSFLFDGERGELFNSEGKVALTGKQRQILSVLVDSGTRFVSKEELQAEVWKDANVSDHTVSVHVSNLNVILDQQIEQLSGIGYRLRNLTKRVEHKYSFEDVWEGAREVGEQVFGSFNANAILTFAGPSAVFANLVMARYLEREALLEMPVCLALQRDWQPSDPKRKLPMAPGYTSVPGEGVVIFIPDTLAELTKESRKPLRLAVIDDVIISAAVMASLRPYLQKRLGSLARIEFACFICFDKIPKVMRYRKPEFASVWSETENFTLPWGPPLWFGKQ